MATKDITDKQVCEAYKDVAIIKKNGDIFSMCIFPHELLQIRTKECRKVCIRATQRAENRGFIDCGITLRSGWLTDEGKELADE